MISVVPSSEFGQERPWVFGHGWNVNQYMTVEISLESLLANYLSTIHYSLLHKSPRQQRHQPSVAERRNAYWINVDIEVFKPQYPKKEVVTERYIFLKIPQLRFIVRSPCCHLVFA
jgi:hypothetical protein